MFVASLLLAFAADTIAFTDVNVLPMDRPIVLEHQTVIVADGRIVAMGPSKSVVAPRGARIVDGTGKFLMPALADMHVHLTTVEELPMYVGYGVLTVRDLNGSAETLAWRAATAKGTLIGPRIFVSAPMIAGGSIPWRNKVMPTTAAEADSLVRAFKIAGYDQIKIYDGITKAVFDASMAAAKQVGLRASGHIPATVGFDGVLAAGLNLEHLDKTVFATTQHNLDTALIPSIAERIKRSGVWVTPTLESMVQMSKIGTGRFDSLMSRPEAIAAPAGLREYWGSISSRLRGDRKLPSTVVCNPWCEYQLRLAGALAKAGVPMLAGTDLPNAVLVPGYSLVRELEVMVAAGATPFQALVAATAAPALFFGEDKEWGTVAVGKRANLILVERTPMTDVTALRALAGVVSNGKWIDQRELVRLRGTP
jgi:imidazolonepropionase-like amidohydrolase